MNGFKAFHKPRSRSTELHFYRVHEPDHPRYPGGLCRLAGQHRYGPPTAKHHHSARCRRPSIPKSNPEQEAPLWLNPARGFVAKRPRTRGMSVDRPERSFTRSTFTGGNRFLSCRSALICVERPLPGRANSHSRPKAACREFGKRTFNVELTDAARLYRAASRD